MSAGCAVINPVLSSIQDKLPPTLWTRAEPEHTGSEKLPVSQKPGGSEAKQYTAVAQQSTPGLQVLRYLGTPPATLPPAHASKAQTLSLAVRQIVPPGWQVVFSYEVKPDEPVALQWQGQAQWTSALNALLRQQNKQALITWHTKKVFVAAGSERAADPLGKPASALPSGGTVTSRTPEALTQPKIWLIAAGSTLKEALSSWAANERCATPGLANWTVAWQTAANYRVDAPLMFKGDLHDALNGLFELYAKAKVPLYVGVRQEQCVISVDSREID